ncbi:MAG: hypothetical protein IT452_09730 [Planctomycetia bacterium]|nr:hypothetical protein [Planctomycetia bacterium]
MKLVRTALLLALAVNAHAGNLLKNGGFESGPARPPEGWTLEDRARPLGALEWDESAPGGKRALRLVPTPKNTRLDAPFGVGQSIPVETLAGKTLRVAARLRCDGAAVGQVVTLVVRRGGAFELGPTLKDEILKGQWRLYRNSLRLPRDATSVVLVLAVLGTSGTASFDDVELAEGPSRVEEDRALDLEAAKTTVRVSVDAGKDLRRVNTDVFGTNIPWVWNGNWLWDDRANRLDPALVALSRDLGPSVLRFPAGFFADYYHWRDGVGDRSKRPERPHDVGKETSPNNFGTDELVEFSRLTGGRLMLQANIVTGTPEEAAAWAGYLKSKGALDRVAYWELGNESYLNDGGPQSATSARTPREYAALVKPFAKAIRAVDPDAKIIAIGAERWEARDGAGADHDWNGPVLEAAGDDIDALAVHVGYYPICYPDRDEPVETVYRFMLAGPEAVAAKFARFEGDIRRHAPGRAGKIGLALTEWAPFFHFKPDERFVDHIRTLGSAVYTAALARLLLDTPGVRVANYFQLCDPIFNGTIGANGKAPRATYYALQLFTRHFGTTLVPSSAAGPAFDAPSLGYGGDIQEAPYVLVLASRSEDGRRLFVMAINRNLSAGMPVEVEVKGFAPKAAGIAWRLSGKAMDAHNGCDNFTPPGMTWAKQAHAEGSPAFEEWKAGSVTLEGRPFAGFGGTFRDVLPEHSVTVYEMEAE